MDYLPIGDTAVTFTLPDAPRAIALAAALTAAPRPGVVAVLPAFDRVTVLYDVTAMPTADPVVALAEWVQHVAATAADTATSSAVRTIELPVRYGGIDGPDLALLAASLRMSEAKLIDLHAGATYTVAAVGFLPGFAYLDGLPPRLHAARRDTPRVKVPAGSVAIGGPYTGVYPVASPGGWHLIGRADVRLFDPASPTAVPLRVGDRVRFVGVR